MSHSGGHTVLAVPVPALEEVVTARTAHYDASFLSPDPDFVHAHITVLAPWMTAPTEADLARVARVAAEAEPFEIALTEIGEFPDGVLYLRPEPDAPLRALTARLAAEFPDHSPYAGRYGDVVPHLTLDRRSAEVTPELVHRWVDHLIPLTLTVDRIDLQWWANHDCRLLDRWFLGGPAGTGLSASTRGDERR